MLDYDKCMKPMRDLREKRIAEEKRAHDEKIRLLKSQKDRFNEILLVIETQLGILLDGGKSDILCNTKITEESFTTEVRTDYVRELLGMVGTVGPWSAVIETLSRHLRPFTAYSLADKTGIRLVCDYKEQEKPKLKELDPTLGTAKPAPKRSRLDLRNPTI